MEENPQVHTDYTTLINACIRHDRMAEEVFYKKFFAGASRTCSRYLTQRADVVQIVNEGFLKVFQNVKQYNSRQGTVGAWIHRIMVNTAIDHLRKEKRTLTRQAHELTEQEVQHTSYNEGLLQLEADEILELVRQLPPITRTVFNFYVMEGYNHKEIAEQLNISEGTSRWHLSESRKRLKQMLLKQEKVLNETKNYT